MIARIVAAGLPLLFAAVLPSMAQPPDESRAHDPVGFGEGQPIPATLTLNYSEEGRDARLTPVRNNYRPKVRFNGREVICMMRMERGTSIEPGESGEVHLECTEPVAVAGSRHPVIDGGKEVGFVDIHLPPAPTD